VGTGGPRGRNRAAGPGGAAGRAAAGPGAHLEEQILTGEPPDPTRIPDGCRFHPRCPALASGAAARAGVDHQCRTEPVPILGGVAEHHAACFLTDESVKMTGADRVGR
jgi:hypothetical protein